MRILDISIFMLIFTMTLSAFNGLNMFKAPVTHQVNVNPPKPNYTEIIPSKTNMTEGEYAGWSFFIGTVYVLKMLPKIFQPTYDIGGYLHSLFPVIPYSICLVLTVIVDMMQLIGLLQIIRGVTFKWMQ